MNITAYINEFLKEHNRVVVSGFGEFFLKNAKAVVDEKTKSILPPAKEIGFTIDYQVRDQKLVNYISKKTATSALRVESDLIKLTDYWRKQLSEARQLSIEGLGRFSQTDDELKFHGERIEKASPDFYGLEEIDLQNLKTYSGNHHSEDNYKFNNSILWLFLLILPVLGIIFLAFTQRERVFGKKSFDDLSVKTSTHRINDSAKINRANQDVSRIDSLRLDSIKQDSIKKPVVPVYKKPLKKFTTKKYKSKKWSKSKKRANR